MLNPSITECPGDRAPHPSGRGRPTDASTMTTPDRFQRDNAVVDAIAEACAGSRARIAAEDARMLRQLADAWALADEQTARLTSRDSRERDMPLRCIAAQIGAELHLDDRTVQTRMHDAHLLVTGFAATVDALAHGRITKAHADVILHTGSVLDQPDVRAAFETVVLEWAERETAGRTRAYARQLAERLHPRSMAERHADAADERSITVIDLDDGMSEIIARVPTVLARGILDRLTRCARAIGDADRERLARARGAAGSPDAVGSPDGPCSAAEPLPRDERTLDQVRSDVFCDMLLTGAPAIDPTDDVAGGLGAIRAQVQITMPITTLTGVSQGGAELDGRSCIDPESARRLAGGAPVWSRVMLDPVTAMVVTVDRYRPTPEQRRFLHARDRHCRFPGCRMPARRCQVDHNHERHDGGPTTLSNLGCFCVRHHTMKTETAWTVRQLPGGRLEWTSPSGRAHIDDPPPTVAFAPSIDPPPF